MTAEAETRKRMRPGATRHPGGPDAPLLDWIDGAGDAATLLDFDFPRSTFGEGLASRTIRMLRPSPCGGETKFLARFRQAGGHSELPVMDAAQGDISLPLPPIPATRRLVAGVSRMDEVGTFAEHFRRMRIPIIVPLPADAPRSTTGVAPLQDYRELRLVEDGGGQAFLYFSLADGDRSRKRAVPPTRFARRERRHLTQAADLIHDGGYVSEGDGQYSWLWTGPSSHFRLIAPRVAGSRPRLAELCIPRTEDRVNLDRLAVQVDGRPASFTIDRWSDSSGRVRVEIPDGEGYVVLTLVTPCMTRDGGAGRLLGLCIDKMTLES